MGIRVEARSLLFREFEDGSVCYDALSGETWLLSALAAFLLQSCRTDGGQTTRDALLAQVLATDDSGAPAEAADALIDDALAELERAGLIEPLTTS